jgi:methylenetetrahydrofolate reductase (NADPH)
LDCLLEAKGSNVHLSIELVPRDETALRAELAEIQHALTQVNMINIPDIGRMKMRSWQGAVLAKEYYATVIPHVRAVDFDLHHPLPFASILEQAGIQSVLVVTGETPKTELRPVYPNTCLDLIRKLRHDYPEWRIYAAIDPYRQSLQAEYRYAQEKLEAGADGFFTQPFFDLRLMEIYAEMLPAVPIYWGVSPVVTKRSQDYWETVNHTIFPRHFELTLDWNRRFAEAALRFARERDQHLYFMPIRLNVVEYLGGIL